MNISPFLKKCLYAKQGVSPYSPGGIPGRIIFDRSRGMTHYCISLSTYWRRALGPIRWQHPRFPSDYDKIMFCVGDWTMTFAEKCLHPECIISELNLEYPGCISMLIPSSYLKYRLAITSEMDFTPEIAKFNVVQEKFKLKGAFYVYRALKWNNEKYRILRILW